MGPSQRTTGNDDLRPRRVRHFRRFKIRNSIRSRSALGSGTRFSYLESLAPLDDSFEFFGGGFDIDHLIAFETADDMFDMSEGWSGRMQYLIGISTVQLTPRTGAGFYSVDLEGIENDGCNGTGCDLGFNSTPFTIPIVANFTLDRLRASDVRRRERWTWDDACARHRRLLRQRRPRPMAD